jgi:hypothetical protein
MDWGVMLEGELLFSVVEVVDMMELGDWEALW